MVKIKTKKEVKLPELIEWGFKQKELPPLFYGDKEGSLVQFTPGGWVNVTAIEPTDTFKVEIEESITEHTVFPKLVTRNTSGRYNGWTSECVKSFHLELIEAIYILNDDLTMTLIWRDGRLIE